jgi:hypothetical protein
MTDAEIDFIMDAIEETALNFIEWSEDYVYDDTTNEYAFNGATTNLNVDAWFNTGIWYNQAVISHDPSSPNKLVLN